MTETDDDDFNTNLYWKKTTNRYSTADVIWRIPPGIRDGLYRVVYKGRFRKTADVRDENSIGSFTGVSEEFEIKGSVYAPLSGTVSRKGNRIELSFGGDVSGDLLTFRLKEGSGAFVGKAIVDFGDGTKYPISALIDDGRTIRFQSPDRKVSKIVIEFSEASDNIADSVEAFEFYDTGIENRVKKFEPFCT